MHDIHLLHENYELRELRNGVAILRNLKTGEEIKQSIRVNLNDEVVVSLPWALGR